MHIYHFIWGENVVFFRASLGHAGSNEVWPWLAPNCLSSLEECPPSQGTPSSKGGGLILAWRARPMDKLQSSPDPLASFLSWAPLPLTPHRVQRKPWGEKNRACVCLYVLFFCGGCCIATMATFYRIIQSACIVLHSVLIKAAHSLLFWAFEQRVLYHLCLEGLK